MKLISLTRGYHAIVDDADYPELSQYKWQVTFFNGDHRCAYAKRTLGTRPSKKSVLMHRQLLVLPSGHLVDHLNRNGLDNRRHNLRPATKAQNSQNSIRRARLARFKGVDKLPGGSFRARIRVDGRQKTLGCFLTEKEAAVAYDAAAIKHFGAFALPNFAVIE